MKKYFFSILAVALLPICGFSQIPNGGFESWTSMGTYDNPDSWSTMNNTTSDSSIYTAEKGTPGNPGASYLKITSKTIGAIVVNGIAVSGVLDTMTMQPRSGFAYTLRPVSFTGKWQHMIFGTSQGSVSAVLTRWDAGLNARVVVASAMQTLSGMAMSWANFSIPFVYTDSSAPDTCIIFLQASGHTPANADYLWVDNLDFSFTTGVSETADFITNLVVYSNPGKDQIIINMNVKNSEQATIELTDITGKIIASENAGMLSGESTRTLTISGIAAGAYFVRIVTKSGTAVKKIMLEK